MLIEDISIYYATSIYTGYMQARNAIHADPIVNILGNKKIDGNLPTYQDHWSILHILQLSHPGMLFFLAAHGQADDV